MHAVDCIVRGTARRVNCDGHTLLYQPRQEHSLEKIGNVPKVEMAAFLHRPSTGGALYTLKVLFRPDEPDAEVIEGMQQLETRFGIPPSPSKVVELTLGAFPSHHSLKPYKSSIIATNLSASL
ncbi:MAG: hypothetical protein V3R80_04475 [Candidatus Tectomicrobia bacterium]